MQCEASLSCVRIRTQTSEHPSVLSLSKAVECKIAIQYLWQAAEILSMLAPAPPIFALATVGALLGAKNRKSWAGQVKALEADCLAGNSNNSNKQHPIDTKVFSWEMLPPIVKHYFNRVFSLDEYGEQHDTDWMSQPVFDAPMINSLRFHQAGLIRQDNTWRSMSAIQTIGSQPCNPGFVWQAEMYLVDGSWKRWAPKVLVCDAWVKGDGHLIASLQGVVPLVTESAYQEHMPELQKGEMMRFLAEAFLTPTLLLPAAGVVTWKATNKKNTALLSMKSASDGATCEVEVTFLSYTILVSGVRPKVEEKSFVDQPWIEELSNFRLIDNMWIPTHMECGWINQQTGCLDMYFVADGFEMEFAFATPLAVDLLL